MVFIQKYFKFIPFAAVVMAMAAVSCNKESSPVVPESSSSEESAIAFSAAGDGLISVETDTKASVVTSLTSSGFYASACTGTVGSTIANVWNSAKFSYNSEDSKYYGSKYWPASNPSYHFFASNIALTSTSSSYTVAATNSTDVICAYLASPTYKGSNTLTFEHIFARLGTVTVSAVSGYTLSNISITITPKTGGTYNLYTGYGKTDGTGWSSTATGSETAIANATAGAKNNDIYLVPGTYTLSASWTATIGDYTQSLSSSAEVSLVGGKVNSISTTLGGNADEIAFSVSITAWGSNSINADFDY